MGNSPPTPLDNLLFGYRFVQINGGLYVPAEGALNFVGAGIIAADNAANGSTDITFTNASPAGYQTSYSLDLTAQGTINVSANGPVTIGGQSWTRANAANESVAMTLNSNGLTGEPTPVTAFFSGGGVIAPGIYLPLTSIISSLGPSTPIRASIYAPTMTGAVGNHAAVAIYNSAAECYVYSGRYVSGSSVVTNPASGWSLSSSPNVLGPVIDSGRTSDNVFQIEFPMGIGSMLAYCRSGVWSSGYPSVTSMVTGYQTVPSSYSNSATFSAYLGAPSQWNIYLGFANRLSNGIGTGTIANLLVEYRL